MPDLVPAGLVRSSDVLPAVEFFKLVRRVVGFGARDPIFEPHGVVVPQVAGNPDLVQSVLLRRILYALLQGGEFRRADVADLDLPTSRLVIALVDLRKAGTLGRERWLNAAVACST